MRRRTCIAMIACVGLAFSVPGHTQAQPVYSGGVQWIASDFFDEASQDWNLGMGFNVTFAGNLTRTLDVRADWGARWADGEGTLIRNANRVPDFGGRVGEMNDGIRVMPATLDLVYRFEDWSQGRFWIPFAAAGLGFYDMRARFMTPGGEEVNRNLFRFGWNARAGVQLHRTTGWFVMLESALHVVDVPGAWTPQYDIGLGFGTHLPR